MLDLEHNMPEEITKQISRPTLIVHSPNAVSFEHAQHAHNLIQNSLLFEAKTWGHGSPEVKQKVAHFL